MATIHDLPGVISRAGSSFDWTVWTQDSEVTVVQVPWTPEYKDIVQFNSAKGLSPDKYDSIDEYIDRRPTKLQFMNMSYLDVNKPIRLPYGIGELQFYNYVRVRNPAQPGIPDRPRTFYYFIMDMRRLAPGTTELIVQLDVWQTFKDYIQFGNCYIERGHVLMSDTRQFNNFGRDFLTQPEGLDIGSDHQLLMSESYGAFGASDSAVYDVLVASTIDFTKDFGTEKNPKLNMARATVAQHIYNGIALYAMSKETWQVLSAALQSFPWIAQGIVSITAVPALVLNYSKLSKINIPNIKIANTSVYTLDGADDTAIDSKKFIDLLKGWRDAIAKRPFYDTFKKLFTYPYMTIDITTNTGNKLSLKPELYNTDNVFIAQMSQIVPPNPRVVYSPLGYNFDYHDAAWWKENMDKYNLVSLFTSDGYEYQTGIYNYPSFVMANDGARLAMASQAHSIAWQYKNSDWSQQKALNSANVAAQQATNAIATNSGQTTIANDARSQQTGIANANAYKQWEINSAGGLAKGVLSGIGGGPAGVVGGLLGGAANMIQGGFSTAANMDARNASTAVSNAAATGSTELANAHAGMVRDTNLQYAQFAANGDYQNSIAQINAKVQDIELTPPSSVGQSGGDAFMLALWSWAVVAKVEGLPYGTLSNLCQFWARFGYAVNKWVLFQNMANLNPMNIYTYWKMQEVYLRGYYCPQNYLTTIRGIFEKGVTVWANPNDIGNVRPWDNKPQDIKEYIYG